MYASPPATYRSKRNVKKFEQLDAEGKVIAFNQSKDAASAAKKFMITKSSNPDQEDDQITSIIVVRAPMEKVGTQKIYIYKVTANRIQNPNEHQRAYGMRYVKTAQLQSELSKQSDILHQMVNDIKARQMSR